MSGNRARATAGSLAAALLALAAQSGYAAEQGPLSALPYTPGLDPAAMDRGVDPCEDFFTYSCGGWLASNPIPADQSSWNVYRKLADDNLRYLWGLLEAAAGTSAVRDANQQKTGDYFAACMDTGRLEVLGASPLREQLEAIEALDSRAGAAGLVARLHTGGGNGDVLFAYTALQDFDDAERVIGTLFSGGLGLPDRDYYLSDAPKMRDARQRYRDHIARMLQLLGDSRWRARAQARKILAIETRLAEATLTRVEQRDATMLNHPMGPDELARRAPGFDWATYFALRPVADATRINVTEPEFLTAVARIVGTAPMPDLRAYLRWSHLRGNAALLSKAFVDEDFDFNSRYLLGVQQQRPRWKTCVANVDADLGEALGRVFVEQTFSEDTRAQSLAMVETIQSVMGERLAQLPWMSPATRMEAAAKLAGMRNKIGHPERWRDYGPVEIRRDDYFGNHRRAAAFEEARQLAKVGRPVDKDEWFMTPQTVNAYYDPQLNDMNFTAAVLQPPLFDARIDPAPSWGNTGSTIGHELIHGFDDSGRDFDARGNLRDWWTEEDGRQFEARAECLVRQYAGYVIVDDIKINSRLTLGEDMADLGGTVLAFMGWKAATAGQAPESRDGLTPEQRFFVGFAQWACGHMTDEEARVRALTGVHSPLRYRINGVVVNLPEFAEAFHCKAGQAMFREAADVCRIW